MFNFFFPPVVGEIAFFYGCVHALVSVLFFSGDICVFSNVFFVVRGDFNFFHARWAPDPAISGVIGS